MSVVSSSFSQASFDKTIRNIFGKKAEGTLSNAFNTPPSENTIGMESFRAEDGGLLVRIQNAERLGTEGNRNSLVLRDHLGDDPPSEISFSLTDSQESRLNPLGKKFDKINGDDVQRLLKKLTDSKAYRYELVAESNGIVTFRRKEKENLPLSLVPKNKQDLFRDVWSRLDATNQQTLIDLAGTGISDEKLKILGNGLKHVSDATNQQTLIDLAGTGISDEKLKALGNGLQHVSDTTNQQGLIALANVEVRRLKILAGIFSKISNNVSQQALITYANQSDVNNKLDALNKDLQEFSDDKNKQSLIDFVVHNNPDTATLNSLKTLLGNLAQGTDAKKEKENQLYLIELAKTGASPDQLNAYAAALPRIKERLDKARLSALVQNNGIDATEIQKIADSLSNAGNRAQRDNAFSASGREFLKRVQDINGLQDLDGAAQASLISFARDPNIKPTHLNQIATHLQSGKLNASSDQRVLLKDLVVANASNDNIDFVNNNYIGLQREIKVVLNEHRTNPGSQSFSRVLDGMKSLMQTQGQTVIENFVKNYTLDGDALDNLALGDLLPARIAQRHPNVNYNQSNNPSLILQNAKNVILAQPNLNGKTVATAALKDNLGNAINLPASVFVSGSDAGNLSSPATAGLNDGNGGKTGKGNGMLRESTFKVIGAQGTLAPRNTDSEVKILEKVLEYLLKNPRQQATSMTLNIESNRRPCASCTDLFKKVKTDTQTKFNGQTLAEIFKNVTINVTYP
ncbi:hypothetical protein M23134_03536 [Microscilla marina ATCC 23134]|uniref:Uncharacterized protein n=1 Tax=Microscilla marina ATCC 23134 TaxID=313606 RepID=A1ZN95_MICM2|nr:hypothetical protein M23134_03536 [Microscilla marina ATCC 23134]